MGGRVVTFELADEILNVFLTTPFEGGRHDRRVAQLTEIEEQEGNR
jgi:ribose 5-phosphate isomerase B